MRSLIVPALLATACGAFGQTYTIRTFAGGALPVGVAPTSASLLPTRGVVADAQGNLYISLPYRHIVVRVPASGGALTLVAGNGMSGFSGDNGPATSAQLSFPAGLALDNTSANLYIADTFNSRVRRVVLATGVISTVAGNGNSGFGGDNGPATSAMLRSPEDVAVDAGGVLYIADKDNHRIRRVAGGTITTFAGNGTAAFAGEGVAATSASLAFPRGVEAASGGIVYIADSANHRVRVVSGGIIRTAAGNGTAAFAGDNGSAIAASLNSPSDVAVDAAGDLYVADTANHRVRRISDGVIRTVAGTAPGGFTGDNGPATNARMNAPNGVDVTSAGVLYISDSENHRIRRVLNGTITTVAGNTDDPVPNGDGAAASARLNKPKGIAVDPGGNVYITDVSSHRLKRVTGGVVSTIAGTGIPGFSGDNGAATAARLTNPEGVALDAAGNIYFADWGYDRIRRITPNGVISTFAGNGNFALSGDNGPATSASLAAPVDIAVDGAGNVYIADRRNHRIRKVTNGTITTVAGSTTPAPATSGSFGGDNGLATAARLNQPQAIAVDSAGNLYIADTSNHRIRKVTVATGIITTVAGNGTAAFSGDNGPATSASLSSPAGVAVDSSGNIYISDTGNFRIRKVTGGTIRTIAGGGTAFGENVAATSARLTSPTLIEVDASGDVYFTDTDNQRVRVLESVPVTITNASPLPNGAVGVPYSQTFVATGGVPPYTWAHTAGTLPNGLNFASAPTLSGTPTTAGTFTFTIRARDSLQTDGTKQFSLTVVPCTVTFTPSPISVPSALAGTGSVNITRNNECGQWTATSNQGWLTITGGTPDTGNGTVQFSFTANPSSTPRSAQITVAGQSVTVTQPGAECRAVFSTPSVNVAAGGVTATVTYTLPSGCTATPSSNVLWLRGTITTPGTMSYTADPNTTEEARAGTITLALGTFRVNQAATCSPTVNPSPVTSGWEGGTFLVSVSRNVSCGQWTATSNQPWVRVTGGSPATGTADIQITIDPNPSTAARPPATLTIAGLGVPVTQEGAPCKATFASPSASAPATGGTATVGFTVPANCSDPLQPTGVNWLSASISGGTLSYTTTRNDSSVGRTATIRTTAGATFTVTQGGAACTFNVTPLSRTTTSAQNTGTIQVATPAGCQWTAAGEQTSPWLRVQGTATKTGTGEVSFIADANPSPNPRRGSIVVGARIFTVEQNGTALSMACTVAATSVPLRRDGITEKAADVNLSCTGVPQGGVVTDVDLTLSSIVTSRVLDAAGTSTEGLAILNNATPPVLGTSAWQAGLGGPNALRWKGVRITGNAQGQATLRLTNIRVNANTGPATVRALVELRSSTRIGLTNPSVNVGATDDAVTVNRGPVTDGPGANQRTVPLIFREQMASAFRTRAVESGFFLASAQANTATRLRFRLSQLPPSVRVLAPLRPVEGDLARLTAADPNGGGAEIPFSNPYVELPRTGDAVTGTWEVRLPTGTLDTLTFPLIIEGATSAQIAAFRMVAGFAPVSTVVTAVGDQPVPRFADTSSFVPPVNLRLIPTRVSLGGATGPLSTKDNRRLAIASSVFSNYDVHNASSQETGATVVRSSAPADFRFEPSGTQAEGNPAVSYSADFTEARFTYNTLPPEAVRGIRFQITGSSEPGDYIEILTTVESRDPDVDLTDNRASVGLITQTCPPNTLAPTSASFGFGQSAGTFNILSSCADWTVQSNDDWVTINSARSGTGAATVAFTVKANPTFEQRVTTITAAGQTFTITQAPKQGVDPCPLTINSTGQTSAPAEGRQGQLGVTLTAGNCAWTARSDKSWLELYPLQGNTSIPVSFTVYPNFGTRERTATVTIGSQSVTITQTGMSGAQDVRYVRRAYFNALRRLPNADEEQFHLGRLNSGVSRASVMQSFLDGKEFKTGGAFVTGLYRVLLGRPPERGGWAFQLNSVVQLKTPQPTLSGVFLGSPEWRLKQGGEISDEAFIILLYEEALDRTPSKAEIDWQLGNLRRSSRAQMATSFLSGDEFFLRRGPLLNATHAYFVILGRDPSPAELTNLENRLRSGTSLPAVIAEFVNSAEHNGSLQ